MVQMAVERSGGLGSVAKERKAVWKRHPLWRSEGMKRRVGAKGGVGGKDGKGSAGKSGYVVCFVLLGEVRLC